jgi:hypothetical protein
MRTIWLVASIAGASCGSGDGAGRDGPTGPACAEGAVTQPCACGGATVTTGYCCADSPQATPCAGPITDVIAADRITAWNPGILADDQLGLPLGPDRLPQRTTVCATVAPGGDIQAAIDGCPEGQVVELGPGTHTVSETITLTRGVVVRGAGSQGAPGGTTIEKIGGETVLAIGTDRDQICYGGAAVDLAADAAKEASTISVGAAAAGDFAPGDLALVDIVDDAAVQQGDCPYFKRVSGRSASQRVEIAAVDTQTGELTLGSPLHWPFPAASPYLGQVTRVTRPVTRWAGIERLRIAGGTNPGYNGQMAGGIDISNAAYCWVKDVQTDAVGGMHVAMTGTYRCVVRDSYLHHSANYGFGADCYGIVLRCGAAENLIENNIVRYMNKPIMFNVTGGGNVVAYNYADNSWATPPEWQEVNIDTHCAFPHMELMEGNYAPHMGATITHGNAGYLTFYRNYASSQFARPAVVGADVTQTGNVTALQFQTGDVGMNAVGNVLGTAGVSAIYDGYDSGTPSIFSLGSATDVSATSLFRHGNFDAVNADTVWDPSTEARTLPPSLYLRGIPAWWPDGTAWPWVGPDLTPMVGELPAKVRSDLIGP